MCQMSRCVILGFRWSMRVLVGRGNVHAVLKTDDSSLIPPASGGKQLLPRNEAITSASLCHY